ncbi:MAG TPA: hypothetical protein VH682_16240 [Gemmataceae bacterium]|jgi:hypothetical protein
MRSGKRFNTLLVVVRDHMLEVFVNGVTVGQPAQLPPELRPAGAGVLAVQRSKATTAECKRYTVWALPDPVVGSEPQRPLIGHDPTDAVLGVAVSPDGRQAA